MLKKLINSIFLLSLISCSGVQVIKGFSPEKNVVTSPGQIKKVSVSPEASDVLCGTEKIKPARQSGKHYFVFAESYFSNRASVNCEVMKNGTKMYDQKIKISKKDYPFETLSVNPKRVKLNKKDLERVVKERKILKKVYQVRNEKLLIDSDFSIPLKSKVTSFYGTRRLFNNVRKSQHLGIDYRAKVGVPIPSSNKGKVVLAKNLFYTGNTVIIDHGLGIFTLYGHLNKVLVKEGEMVSKKQILGEAGKTGRVTGPHLHWGVKVNGHWVDGNILTKLDLP